MSSTKPRPLPPHVATEVTAQAGRFRYRVLAYRPLEYMEVTDVVCLAIERGWVEEPAPHACVTIYTSIGARETATSRSAHSSGPLPMGIERCL